MWTDNKPGTVARVMNYLQRDGSFCIEYPLIVVLFAYLTDLYRPTESRSEPDPKMLMGVYRLHTCLFKLEKCGLEGGMPSSGDDHIFAFSAIELQKVIIRPCTQVINAHL